MAPTLRIGAAVTLLLFGLIELLRFLALTVSARALSRVGAFYNPHLARPRRHAAVRTWRLAHVLLRDREWIESRGSVEPSSARTKRASP